MIEGMVLSFGLILARVGTFVAIMPLFGTSSTPRSVKVGLVVALTVFWSGAVDVHPAADFANHATAAQWLGYGLALGREAVLGAILGFAFGLFLVPLRVAGEYLGQEMGLVVSPTLDPTSVNAAGAVTQLYETLGAIVFLGLNLHHLILVVLHGLFVRVPVGQSLGPVPFGGLVKGAAVAEEYGLLLVAPLGACLFLTSVVLALLARVAPQLNVFSIGFAVRAAVGLGMSILLLPAMIQALGKVFENLSGYILKLLS